jgi:N-formylglutamate deformylase
VSRVVVDSERFLDDAIEPMASRGMGAVYTATTDGARLRVGLRETERDELLARFYEPHHEMLEAATENVLSATGRCLIIDGHSFPSEPLPSDLNQEHPRPQVCIGTDPFHMPSKLASEAVERFRARGLTVAITRPYAGALVPARWYRRDKRVSALMVEVNRHLYMDEATGQKTRDFPTTSAAVQAVLESLMADRASLW